MKNKIIILLYHNLLSENEEQGTDKGSIKITTLLEHIEMLNKCGYQNISLEKAIDCIVSGEEVLQKLYALTFDDSFESLFKYLPKLIKTTKPTVFAITDYVGKSNLWNTRATNKLFHMRLEMMQELQGLGVDFQFHGTDHHNLVKFSTNELENKFQLGCAWFEQYLQKTPKYIAYPYGSFNEKVVAVAEKYFKNGVSVNHGAWFGSDADFKINRLSVPFYINAKELVEIIEGPLHNAWMRFEEKAPWAA